MKIDRPCFIKALGLTSNHIKEILDNLGDDAINVQFGSHTPIGTVVIPIEYALISTIDKYLNKNCIVITATNLSADNVLTYYPQDALSTFAYETLLIASTSMISLDRTRSVMLSSLVYGNYAAEQSNLTVNSRFCDGRLLASDATGLYGRDYFHRNHYEFNRHLYLSSVVWSEYHDAWVNRDQDHLHCGYYTDDTDDDSGWFVNTSAVYVPENDNWYFNNYIAECHGFSFNEGNSTWGTSVITARYHSLSRVFRFPSYETPKFSIGFEIEKEDKEACSIDSTALYRDTEWIKEADSSLDRSIGYELVSPAFDMFSHEMENEISRSEDLQQLINAKSSSNCGGHINIASSEYNTKELFEGLSAFMPLLYSMYESRIEKHYSMAKEKHLYLDSNADKYAAVFIKRNVLEIRIFSAVKSIENLLWRQDLVRIMCNNINKSETDVLKMLCNQKSKLYKHLRKVYTQAEIINKIGMFVTFSKNFNHKKLSYADLTEMPVDGIQDVDSLGA